VGSPLEQYVAWSPEKRIKECGQEKLCEFTSLLSKMSELIIELIEKGYFASNERAELSHMFSWMLGCTEYGLLSTESMEIGYYDRIADKYCAYLKQDFSRDK